MSIINYDSSSSSEAAKMCKECEVLLPLSAFTSQLGKTDGLRAKCRQCRAIEYQEYMSRKHQLADCITPPAKRMKLEPTIHGEHLYVMAISTDPTGEQHGLKIGRSCNILRRSNELATSMPFEMLVLATFLGQGHLEDAVHSALALTRNNGGRGREWFHVPLHTILHVVGCAMAAIVNGTGATEQSLGSPGSCPIVASSEEEGAGDYQEGGGCLCEEEGGEADLPSSSACTRQNDLRVA
jgi:hypothetical protein